MPQLSPVMRALLEALASSGARLVIDSVNETAVGVRPVQASATELDTAARALHRQGLVRAFMRNSAVVVYMISDRGMRSLGRPTVSQRRALVSLMEPAIAG